MIRFASLLLCATVLTAAGPRQLSEFGLVGDGKADDTAAIQKAVDEGIGELRFWRGRFRITRPIVVRLDRVGPVSISGAGVATIVMAGEGPAFHLIGTHAGSAAPDSVKANVWERQRAPMVDSLEIVGAHADAIGLRLEGLMQPTLTRLVIRKVRHGILITGRNRNVAISDCHVYDNSGVGVLLESLNLHQINIASSHISYNRGGGIVIRKSEVRNIQIGTSDIEANQDRKGPPTANILFDAREGSILEGAVTGCTVQHGHEAPGSANIRFLGPNAGDPNKVGNFVITGNALSDVRTNIHLQYARGVVVTANTFWKGYDHHVLVEGSSNILIGVNNIDRNPDYKPGDSVDDVVFTDCADSSIAGLHMNRAGHPGPALILRRCRRFDLSNVRVLDPSGTPFVIDSVQELSVSGGNLEVPGASPNSLRK
jgi:polygalacturonase